MKHLLTCCELPKCLLDREDELNDYDFVLYHQYLKDEVYRNNYLNKRKTNPDRIMILDNSAYEFFVSGERFNEDDFIRVIRELKPTYYIVPDVLMNKQKTLDNFYHWIDIVLGFKEEGLESEPYFVPQGRTIEEMESCMTAMNFHIKGEHLPQNFCIPFHNDFFLDRSALKSSRLQRIFFGCEPMTKDDEYALGRMVFMDKVLSNGQYTGYTFHMLGSHNPIETKFYEIFDCIKTFDSGYPVKLAIAGEKYGEQKEKPNIIIDDFYNQDLSDITKYLIIYNVNEMKRRICARSDEYPEVSSVANTEGAQEACNSRDQRLY